MRVLIAALALACCAANARADSVDSAYRLCAVFDGTGLLSQKCEVSGWGSSVDVSIDMSAAEARSLCAQIVGSDQVMSALSFDPGWQIRIFSPFSGDRPIASCGLR